MNRRQRQILVGALLVVVVLSATAGYLWGMSSSSPAASTGPISTSPTSHVHTLQVENDGTLVLGDQDGLWHARPGGRHWRLFGAPLSHLMPICLARLGSKIMIAGTTGLSSKTFGTPKGLWRSTNGGKTWSLTALPDKYVTVLAVNPAVPQTVVAFAQPDSPTGGVGHGGIWVSTDAGLQWHRVNTSLALKAVNGMVLLQGHPFTVLWADNQGIYRSSNGGGTWHFSTLGQAQTLSLTASPLGPSVAFAGAGALGAAGSGIWMTRDSGATWHLKWVAPPTPVLGPTTDLYRQVYGYASTSHPFIYLTGRLQATAVRQVAAGRPPVPSSQPALIVADPAVPGRVYAAYSFPLRIFESNDFARTWRKIL